MFQSKYTRPQLRQGAVPQLLIGRAEKPKKKRRLLIRGNLEPDGSTEKNVNLKNNTQQKTRYKSMRMKVKMKMELKIYLKNFLKKTLKFQILGSKFLFL